MITKVIVIVVCSGISGIFSGFIINNENQDFHPDNCVILEKSPLKQNKDTIQENNMLY